MFASIPGLAISPTIAVWLFGVGLLVYAFRSGDFLLFFKERKWACTGLLAYAGAALFAACRPHYSIGTYAMWVVPPMTYLAAAPLQGFRR